MQPKGLKMGLRELTKTVKPIAIKSTAYPALDAGNSSTRFLATNEQKITAGTRISNTVTISDLASGPNINRPLRKNFCNETNKKEGTLINST